MNIFHWHFVDQGYEAAREMAENRLRDHQQWVENGCTHEGPQSPYISTIEYDRLINNGHDTSALTRGMS